MKRLLDNILNNDDTWKYCASPIRKMTLYTD